MCKGKKGWLSIHTISWWPNLKRNVIRCVCSTVCCIREEYLQKEWICESTTMHGQTKASWEWRMKRYSAVLYPHSQKYTHSAITSSTQVTPDAQFSTTIRWESLIHKKNTQSQYTLHIDLNIVFVVVVLSIQCNKLPQNAPPPIWIIYIYYYRYPKFSSMLPHNCWPPQQPVYLAH